VTGLSLIPSTADSMNSDLRRLYRTLRLYDSTLENPLFDTFHLLLTGRSTGTILTSKSTVSYCWLLVKYPRV
jgi:hypothetical protein